MRGDSSICAQVTGIVLITNERLYCRLVGVRAVPYLSVEGIQANWIDYGRDFYAVNSWKYAHCT
jgi:sucrose-6-phosphate hydrolase SacC (GH32 family)